jgi:5-methylcytosine-specific restriction endonuclease McrA
MLYNYQYVPHKLEKLQQWLKHLVKDIWCTPKPRFTLTMLSPEFRQVEKEIFKASRKNDYLRGPIRKIHNLCRDKLSAKQRSDFSKWFDNNIKIESLCEGRADISPVTYEDIKALNTNLARELEAFCTNLWTEVRKLKPITDRLGTLEEHFKDFRKLNRTAICPYCGISRIEGEFSDIQEDYDHFLPKGTYPFNAVALRNLAPICDKCNKKYKLQKDPLHNQTGLRRKAFFSYAAVNSSIKFNLQLVPIGASPIDPQKLLPANIQINITSPGKAEEIEVWKEVFEIEQRYKDICCQKESGGNYWLEQVLGELKFKGNNPAQALATIKRAASASKWADVNFIKLPFLEACDAAGLIR